MNRAQAPALALLIAACAWAPACGLNQAGVTPPDDTIAFPASAVLDSGRNWLFVTNSNADLRYNDGSLVAFSLDRLTKDREPYDREAPVHPHEEWQDCPRVGYLGPADPTDPLLRCCWDALDRNILNCDERYYVGPDADIGNGDSNVRIGSFAAGMVRQRRVCPATVSTSCGPPPPRCNTCPGVSTCTVPACPDLCTDWAGDDASNDYRLLLDVRGNTSLTFIDVTGPSQADAPPRLTCSLEGVKALQDAEPPVPFATCDEGFRVNHAGSALAGPTAEEHPPDVTLPDEPYALAIDDTSGLLFVGHLSGNTTRPFTGGFSLFDVMPIGDAPLGVPRLIGPFQSPFPPNSAGFVGVTAMKFLNGASVYASSRYVPQVTPLAVTGVCPQPYSTIREIAAFPSGPSYSSPLAGVETRGIEFRHLDDGTVDTNRAFVLQRSPPALIGFLGTTPTDILETCGSPTFLDQHDSGVGARLFVTCVADGEIYVFDPAIPQLVKTFLVGRGPSGLVFDDSHNRHVAYSVNFGDNDIAVIDLEPGSRTEYHVIQRIGFPRVSPR